LDCSKWRYRQWHSIEDGIVDEEWSNFENGTICIIANGDVCFYDTINKQYVEVDEIVSVNNEEWAVYELPDVFCER